MIKNYALFFILATFFTAQAGLEEEKRYIVFGCYECKISEEKGGYYPGMVSIYNYDSGIKNPVLVKSFSSYQRSTVSSAAYFENNGEMQILTRLYNNAIVIQKLDGSIFRKFELQPEDIQAEFDSEIDSSFLRPSSVALLRNSQGNLQILAGYRCGKIVVWDVDTGEKRLFEGNQFRTISYGITALSLFLDSGIIKVAAASCDGSVCIYNFKTGEKLKTFTGFKNWVTSVAVFKDATGFNIVAGSKDGTIRCWNCDDREDQDPRYIIDNRSYYTGPHFEPNDPRHQPGFVYGLNLFKMSNNRIVIAPIAINDDNVLFDAQTGNCIKILKGQVSPSTDIRVYIHNDNTIKLISVCNGFVNLWDVDSGSLEHTFETDILGRNICLFAQDNCMHCAVSFGDIQDLLSSKIGFFNLEEKQQYSVVKTYHPWMNAVASFDQNFQDQTFVAVSPFCSIGSYIGMYDLANIQVINVSE